MLKISSRLTLLRNTLMLTGIETLARLTVSSRCLGRQTFEVRVGKSPSFLAAFLGGTPPFGPAPPGDSESRPSSVMTLSKKKAAPVKRFIFFVFVPRWSF